MKDKLDHMAKCYAQDNEIIIANILESLAAIPEKQLQMKIKQCDTVKHIPSGEMWTVCGINYSTGRLIPCGYPFPSMGDISDCELIESATDEEVLRWKDQYNKALENSYYGHYGSGESN